MSSQLDLDQGGSFRQTQLVYQGPSLGWTSAPSASIVDITAAGTFTLLPGASLVRVNVNGNVTIQLPSAKGNSAGAGAVPGSYLVGQIIFADIGGFANSHNITILPFGSETIDGLSSASINSNYGVVTLVPNVTSGGWNQTQ